MCLVQKLEQQRAETVEVMTLWKRLFAEKDSMNSQTEEKNSQEQCEESNATGAIEVSRTDLAPKRCEKHSSKWSNLVSRCVGAASSWEAAPQGKDLRLTGSCVAAERFRLRGSALLPSFTGQEASRILDAFFQNITKCDVDIRKNVCANAALLGDAAMVKGIGERMTTELTPSAQSTMEIEVLAPSEQTLCMDMDLGGRIPRIRPHSHWKCF